MASFYNHEHRYNDKVHTGFTRMGYSWEGEPYKGPDAPLPDRYKGKRLGVPSIAPTFSKLEYVPSEYGSGGYIRYANAGQKVYPAPAFGSKDFTKHDEFSGYSRMVIYRDQVAKELKVSEKALQNAASQVLGGSGEFSAGAEEGAARMGEDGGAPMTPPKGGARSSTFSRTRDFASPTQFDRLRDHRTSKEIYNIARLYKADHAMDFGSTETAYMGYSESLPTADEMRGQTSPNKRVAVTKQFFRSNCVWTSITGSP
jgi:hypothetical protein